MSHLVELTLDGIAHGGEALGRHEGKVIFVPYAIPGERVQVEVVEERERWARARLVDVLLPSPDRLAPPCPYFGPDGCGGCQWQHIAYERQAELKQAIVADQLRRLGRLAEPPVADTLVLARPFTDESGSAEERGPAPALLAFGYRNHAQFALTPTGQLGFRRVGSHEVIAVERCLLLHERLDELHAALDISWPALTGLSLRAGINTGQALIILETAGEEQPELELELPAACALITPRGVRGLIGDPWIVEEVAGIPYRISATSFFQVNTVGAEAFGMVQFAGKIGLHFLRSLELPPRAPTPPSAPSPARLWRQGGEGRKGFLRRPSAAAAKTPSYSPLSPGRRPRGEGGQRGVRGSEGPRGAESVNQFFEPSRAGVLVLLYPGRDGELSLVLTRRTESVENHRGQISLPGGSMEAGENAVAAALREAQEELAVNPARLELLGKLSPLYIPASGFCIYPVVAYAWERPAFLPDPREVAEVIEVPLAHLLEPSVCCVEQRQMEGREVRVPFYAVGRHKVWGATAMVLCELLTLLSQIVEVEP
jgi:8-oxo-dGTP pyrophosphatase MutT (NUDIX family)/predicted RNA-binding protein with TRAM domain